MDLQAISQTVNWKTIGCGAAYAVCKLVGWVFPAVEPGCSVLETVFVTGGFLADADAGRVQNIVRAVDLLLTKNQVDPATLIPTTK